MNSKPWKDSEYKERSQLYGWWIETSVYEYYRKFVRNFIKNPTYRVGLLWDWYRNVFYRDFDWDGHYLFPIIEYKLKRIQVALIDGHLEQDPKILKALRLAIKLAGRLKKDEYDRNVHTKIVAKWGECKTWFTPVPDRPGLSTWNQKYEKVNTEEDEKKCMEDRHALYDAAEKKMKREEAWMYAILQKYLRSMWD